MKTRHCLGGCLSGVLIVSLAFVGACKREEPKPGAGATGAGATTAKGELALPPIDEGTLPFALQTKIGAARREAQRAPEDVNKVVDLGALCYAHGFPKAAVVCFQQATKLAPDELTWWYYLGLACERAGDSAQAMAAYEKALTLREDSRLARARLAALLLEKDRTRAAELLQRVLTSDPNDVVAHTGLGLCALAEGKTDEARGDFDEVLKVAPRYGPAHGGLAKVLLAQGKTAEAEEQQRLAAGDERLRPVVDPAETALGQRGLDLDALVNGANVLAQRRDFAPAEKLLREAIDIDESGVKARSALGDLFGRQGKIEDAISEFERVLQTPEGKDYAPAKVKLAFALTLSKAYDRAERLLGEVLEQKPDDADALRRLVGLAQQVNAPEKAVPRLQAALSAAPRDAELQSQVGEWLLQLGQDAEAETALQKAAELKPDLAPTHYRLGVALYRKADKSGSAEELASARAEWTKALGLDPKYMEPRLALIQLAAKAKQYAEMERLLRAGLETLPDSPEMANALAWLLATCPEAERRNPEQAVQWAEKACEATKHTDHAMLDTLSAAYAAAGRFDEAKKWIAEAIRQAQVLKQPEAVTEYETRQALYEAGKPYFGG